MNKLPLSIAIIQEVDRTFVDISHINAIIPTKKSSYLYIFLSNKPVVAHNSFSDSYYLSLPTKSGSSKLQILTIFSFYLAVPINSKLTHISHTSLDLNVHIKNNVTLKNSYTLPRIDNTLDTLTQSKWFPTLSLKSGYIHRTEKRHHNRNRKRTLTVLYYAF